MWKVGKNMHVLLKWKHGSLVKLWYLRDWMASKGYDLDKEKLINSPQPAMSNKMNGTSSVKNLADFSDATRDVKLRQKSSKRIREWGCQLQIMTQCGKHRLQWYFTFREFYTLPYRHCWYGWDRGMVGARLCGEFELDSPRVTTRRALPAQGCRPHSGSCSRSSLRTDAMSNPDKTAPSPQPRQERSSSSAVCSVLTTPRTNNSSRWGGQTSQIAY